MQMWSVNLEANPLDGQQQQQQQQQAQQQQQLAQQASGAIPLAMFNAGNMM